MSRAYPVCDAKDSRPLAEFLAKEGQLLPMLDLIGRAEAAVDEVIDVAGRAALEDLVARGPDGQRPAAAHRRGTTNGG
jgi:hypothetical protein